MTGRKYTPDFDEEKAVEIRQDVFDAMGIKISVL